MFAIALLVLMAALVLGMALLSEPAKSDHYADTLRAIGTNIKAQDARDHRRSRIRWG